MIYQLGIQSWMLSETKLLYEFDTEPNPFVQTQVLLLLTNWYSLSEATAEIHGVG
jgi:hypothetical protein